MKTKSEYDEYITRVPTRRGIVKKLHIGQRAKENLQKQNCKKIIQKLIAYISELVVSVVNHLTYKQNEMSPSKVTSGKADGLSNSTFSPALKLHAKTLE